MTCNTILSPVQLCLVCVIGVSVSCTATGPPDTTSGEDPRTRQPDIDNNAGDGTGSDPGNDPAPPTTDTDNDSPGTDDALPDDDDATAGDDAACPTPADASLPRFGLTRVTGSTLGRGRHLVASGNPALAFDLDQPVPDCAVRGSSFRLMDWVNQQAIDVADHQVRQEDGTVPGGTRLWIDLPTNLVPGRLYLVTLDAAALGIDGDFATGTGGPLPSGDGEAGGDFLQVFQWIAGDVFVTDTGGANGIDIGSADGLYAATETAVIGPFDMPGARRTAANTVNLADDQLISGTSGSARGRAFVANDDPTGALATYAAQRQFRLYAVSGSANIASVFEATSGPGPGSFEVDLVELPAGFGGDYLVINNQRGILIDTATGSSRTLFTSDSSLAQWTHLFNSPFGTGETAVYVTLTHTITPAIHIQRVATDGTLADAFAPVPGAGLIAAARLPDSDGEAEYLLLASTAALVSIGMTDQTGPASSEPHSLAVYRPDDGMLQILTGIPACSDLVLSSDGNVAYTSHPDAGTIQRFRGWRRAE